MECGFNLVHHTVTADFMLPRKMSGDFGT